MTVIIDGGAGITFPDTQLQTNAVTMTGGNPLYYAARAWVNFDGTGSVSIRGAVNVSSITDSGTGRYTVNFTTDMPDTVYALVGTVGVASANSLYYVLRLQGTPTVSSVQVGAVVQSSGNPVYTDLEYANVVVFR